MYGNPYAASNGYGPFFAAPLARLHGRRVRGRCRRSSRLPGRPASHPRRLPRPAPVAIPGRFLTFLPSRAAKVFKLASFSQLQTIASKYKRRPPGDRAPQGGDRRPGNGRSSSPSRRPRLTRATTRRCGTSGVTRRPKADEVLPVPGPGLLRLRLVPQGAPRGDLRLRRAVPGVSGPSTARD